jgi:hypothetical protein
MGQVDSALSKKEILFHPGIYTLRIADRSLDVDLSCWNLPVVDNHIRFDTADSVVVRAINEQSRSKSGRFRCRFFQMRKRHAGNVIVATDIPGITKQFCANETES